MRVPRRYETQRDFRYKLLSRELLMRPLRFSLNITVDGCIDHRAGIADVELHQHASKNLAEADAILFGRVIYQMMESAWRAPAETGILLDWMQPWMLDFAQTIHRAKKYVVSRTLEHVDWNAELIKGDLEATVRRLKNEPGRGLFVAGPQLAMELTELGLIDEYQFIVHPRIAGHGPTLFAGLTKWVDLKLVERSEFASGAVVLKYHRTQNEQA